MVTFTLPYTYPIRFIPRKCINHVTVYGRSEIELAFREVGHAEAPVVARLKGDVPQQVMATGNRTLAKPLPDGSARRMRWHQGRHWLEWGPAEELVETLAAGGRGSGTPFEKNGHWHEFTGRSASGRNDDLPRTEDWVRGKYVALRSLDNLDAQMREKLLRTSEDVILVDGVAYEAVCEPNLVLAEAYAGDTYHVMLEWPDGLTYTNFRHYRIPFHLRRERVSELPRFLERLRAEGIKPEVNVGIEILDPGVFFESPLRKAAADAAESALSTLMGAAVGLPREALLATLALRDAVAASPGRVSGDVAAALEAVTRLPGPDTRWMDMYAGRARKAAAERAARMDPYHRYDTTLTFPEAMVEKLEPTLSLARDRASQALAAIRAETPGFAWDSAVPVLPEIGGVREVTAVAEAAMAARHLGLDPRDVAEEARSRRMLVHGTPGTTPSGRPSAPLALAAVDALSTDDPGGIHAGEDLPLAGEIREAFETFMAEAWGLKPVRSPEMMP